MTYYCLLGIMFVVEHSLLTSPEHCCVGLRYYYYYYYYYYYNLRGEQCQLFMGQAH
jgi:hypothetical protein